MSVKLSYLIVIVLCYILFVHAYSEYVMYLSTVGSPTHPAIIGPLTR